MTTDKFVLITDRFTLKPLTPGDAPLLADLGSDPDVVKPLICDWSTPSKRMKIAKYWITRNQEYGIWGVLDRKGIFGEPGQMIGFCAADESLPLGGKGPEIYYAFSRETWGHGVGTEVARVVIDHLFEELGVDAVEALVLAGLNPASGRLLAKLGMSFVGNYPLADYIGEECDPTIDYELWRVKNSTAENARMNLEEAAFKIGQFVGEEMASEKTMFASLLRAATENNHLASENEETLYRLINNSLIAGMAEKGWLHYRIEK